MVLITQLIVLWSLASGLEFQGVFYFLGQQGQV